MPPSKLLIRIARVALWCVLAFTVLISIPILTRELRMQRREQIYEQLIAEFKSNTSEDWASLAANCQAYVETKKEVSRESEMQPFLPANLARLRPFYWEVWNQGIAMEWSNDLDVTLALAYRVEDGKASLWLESEEFEPSEKRVWQESAPSQR